MDGEAVVKRSVADDRVGSVDHAFSSFYRGEYAITLAVVLALRGPRVGADDVAQEAFLRAFRQWGDVRTMEHPERWVRRVAVNLATSRWRRLGAEARALVRSVTPAGSTDAEFDRVDAADRFWRAVRRLPLQQRRVVALRYAADLTVDEVAELLGKAPGTVKSTLHAARKGLVEMLEIEEDER